MNLDKLLQYALPGGAPLAALFAWEAVVRIHDIQPVILRIGGGLALVGATVAEIAAGSAGEGAGLPFRIVESGYRLKIPRMFAALLLISATGIAMFAVLGAFSHLLLHRWRDSARARET